MIVCARCSKENQDHYKFCLGCGAELPRDQAPKDFSAPPPAAAPVPAPQKNLQFAATQQGDASAYEPSAAPPPATEPPPPAVAPEPAPPAPASVPAPAPAPVSVAPAPAGDMVPCPSCSNPVPHDFKFCGTCGHRMEGAAPAQVSAAPAAPAAAAAPAPAAGAAPSGTLVLINPDGSEGDSFQLVGQVVTVGRNAGGVFAADSYVSPDHAIFTFDGGGCSVRDVGSLNGVYVKIPRDQPIVLNSGDVFRIGQEIVRYDAVDASGPVSGVEPMGSPSGGIIGRILLVLGRESTGNAFPIPAEGIHIGRERGDVIFPEDGYVSGLHCRLHHDGTNLVLTDVGSSNGTFMRVEADRQCANGELLLMGQQLFRLQY